MMAKFRIKLKLTGLDLEVEGTRDDLPLLRDALTQQFAGMLNPATELAGGEPIPPRVITGATAAAVVETAKRQRRKGRAAGGAAAAGESKEVAVDWRHDSSKYGSPLQSWKNAEKAVWLLYVASKEADVAEMSNPRIVATFAKHFRQAGPIRANNLPRDLARMKTAQNGQMPFVSEDTTKNPPTWYLTAAGVAQAQKLIAQALGQTTAA